MLGVEAEGQLRVGVHPAVASAPARRRTRLAGRALTSEGWTWEPCALLEGVGRQAV